MTVTRMNTQLDRGLTPKTADPPAGRVWIGDVHPCDVYCRRSDADPTIVRPVLHAWFNLQSRTVAGYAIADRQDSKAIIDAFRAGVRVQGAPDTAIVDGGRLYGAGTVRRPGRQTEKPDGLCSVLRAAGVRVQLQSPYKTDSRPVERWFRALEEQFGATFESYCGGDSAGPRFKAAFAFAQKHPERCPTVGQFGRDLKGYIAKLGGPDAPAGSSLETFSNPAPGDLKTKIPTRPPGRVLRLGARGIAGGSRGNGRWQTPQ